MPPRLPNHIFTTFTELTLLVVLLWPAPVPVGHCHSDEGLGWSEQQLAVHLQTFHGGFTNADNWPSDWHWHWVYQVDTITGANDSSSRTQCDRLVDITNRDACVHPCGSRLDAWVWKNTIISPSVPMNRRHSFMTIGLLASRHSLPELLGVIRC